ncbi:PMEI domain-containing protein [Heracleum sosnowskyi]|uniref:PMEI domain-containing protein n=1 Tax=Heracleum sosnowskyi TaxID=360622 RepID=A0AAD8IIG2_9APIA|nr:PMEI domain-containing protein [Heracleum sosnowskyi]
MASCFISSILFFSAIFVFLSTTPSFANINSKNVTSDRVKNICNATEPWNQPRCYEFYKSDPRSSTADYKELAEITIDLANSDCKKLIHWLNSLAKNETDHGYRRRYLQCSKHYSEAREKLDAGKKYLEAKKFETVEDLAANAIEDSNECIADFAKVNTTSTLLNKAKDFEFITSFVKPAVELSRKSDKVTKKPYYYTLQLILKKWVFHP